MPAFLPFWYASERAEVAPKFLPFWHATGSSAPAQAVAPKFLPYWYSTGSPTPAAAVAPKFLPYWYSTSTPTIPTPPVVSAKFLPFWHSTSPFVPTTPAVATRFLPFWYATAQIVPLPSDLLAAIKLWFAADSTLTTAIPGGLWVTQAPGNQVVPYAVVALISESSDWASGSDQIDQDDLQFSVYGASALEARTAAKLLRKALDGAALAFADGYLMGLYHKQGLLTKDPNRGPRGFLWHQMVLTTAFVGRHS
jgi:hypothetical protein